MAPDGSIFARARDPKTGGRQLEELAFEVVSTETLAHAGRKARGLVERGVRRVFAIDVERKRGLEWSTATEAWEILAPDALIDDPALVLPLPVYDLVSAGKADDAVARALIAKGNPVLHEALEASRQEGRQEGRAEGAAAGKAEAILTVLAGRGLAIDAEEREIIASTRDHGALDAMLEAVMRCESVAALLALARRP